MGLFNLFKKKQKDVRIIQPFSVIKTEQGSFEAFFQKLLRYSLIMLISGKRGSGKTSLGMSILGISNSSGKKCYAVGFGSAKLPRWMHKADSLEKVPVNSAVLIDEGAIVYSSRDSMKESNKMLGKLMAVARHKNLSLFLISQNTSMIDLNVLRLTDVLLLKEPSLLQTEFERPALKKRYAKITPLFKKQKEKAKCFYVWSDDFEGMLSYDLPGFWNNSISKSFKNFGKS